ncbi:MAG: protein kinase, partial [Polyangiaceae bacterium]
MATVYLGRVKKDDASAESTRYHDRVVALKVIRQELAADAGFVEMFLDEAKIIAQLAHPNISETLEVGVDNGHRFIAMELLLGRTLADIWEALAETGASMPV